MAFNKQHIKTYIIVVLLVALGISITLPASDSIGLVVYHGVHRFVDDVVVSGDLIVSGTFTASAYNLSREYAGMYMYENTNSATVVAQNQWHAGLGFSSGSLSSHWTFDAGSQDIFTAMSGSGASTTNIQSVGHGLSAGDVVCIVGTTNYNDFYIINSATPNWFNIPVAFGVDESDADSTWIQGSSLIAGSGADGQYLMVSGGSMQPENNSDIFDWRLYKSSNLLIKSESRASTKQSTEWEEFGHPCLIYVNAGDVIQAGYKNISSTGDVTVRYANIVLACISN